MPSIRRSTKFIQGALGPANPVPALLDASCSNTPAAALLSGAQSQLTAVRESWVQF